MPSSFYPAARKVLSNSIVKWVLGSVVSGAVIVLTTGIWPFFKGWAMTRASTDSVEDIDKRVTVVEDSHAVDFNRLDNAINDDVGKLTEGEKLQWTIIRVKRLQMRLVAITRACVGLEARLRMPHPDSDAARRIAASAMNKFDKFILDGYEPNVSAKKALADTFGVESNQ